MTQFWKGVHWGMGFHWATKKRGETIELLELIWKLRSRTERLTTFINENMKDNALNEIEVIKETLDKIERELTKENEAVKP